MTGELNKAISEFPKMDEEVVEQTIETTPETEVETEIETPEAGATPTEEVRVDKYKILGDTFEREFKTDEDVESFKSSLKGLTEKEKQLVEAQKRLEEMEAENAAYQKEFNPEGMFVNDKSKERFKNLVIHDQLMTKLPGKDPELLFEVISRDYSKAHIDNPIGVLVKDLMLDNPEIFSDEQTAEAAILERYGIDPDNKDENDVIIIPPTKKANMQVDAKGAVAKWNGYKTQVEPPKNVNLADQVKTKRDADTTRKQKITEATETLFTKKIPKSLNAIEFTETVKDDKGERKEVVFKYEIGENFAKSKAVQDDLNSIRASYIQNAVEWTPQIEESVLKEIVSIEKGRYMVQHEAEIYAAITEDLKTKMEDKDWTKRHNVRPLRSDGRTQQPTGKDKEAEEGMNAALEQLHIKVK